MTNPKRLAALGGGAGPATYVEDVFSTYLYTGNGAAVVNGIDLSTKGGLVWMKERATAGYSHALCDTAQGKDKYLISDATTAASTASNICVFNTNGFTPGPYLYTAETGKTYASWTFRKQAKFFDVVTYTGNGSNRTIAHSLGSVPGCIIIKRTDTAADWQVYHRSLTNTEYLVLNSTAAKATGTTRWNSTTPTSTEFSLGTDTTVNANSGTYVAYLFAHDAGGFGAAGTDNVISCGIYTGTGANNNFVDVGFEPQWVMIKRASGGLASWAVVDTMRALGAGSPLMLLYANSSSDEATNSGSTGIAGYCGVTATGFYLPQVYNETNASGNTYVYIAIRRGPMKTPTSGTSVLGLNARSGTGANATVTGGAGVTDLAIIKRRDSTGGPFWVSRLAKTGYMLSNSINAEVAAGATLLQANPWDVMDGIKIGTTGTTVNASGATYINYLIDRAPGFFDVVCYTGTGSARTVSHNLGVTPEFMIVKMRSGTAAWAVFHSSTGSGKYLFLNTVGAADTGSGSTYWNSTLPTSSVFSVGTNGDTNSNGSTYIAYLFASCTGVSKVGSYTGTGTTKQIDCGFAAGARFVMIKRTDANGDWYVWDTARGIVAGNDPYFLINTTAGEVTTTDYIDTSSSGFEISSTAPAEINANGGTFIFLAIA